MTRVGRASLNLTGQTLPPSVPLRHRPPRGRGVSPALRRPVASCPSPPTGRPRGVRSHRRGARTAEAGGHALRLKRTQHPGTNLQGSTEPRKVLGNPFLHRESKTQEQPTKGQMAQTAPAGQAPGAHRPSPRPPGDWEPGTGSHTLAAVGLQRGGVQLASPHACGFAGTGRIHVGVSPGPGGHAHFALVCDVCRSPGKPGATRSRWVPRARLTPRANPQHQARVAGRQGSQTLRCSRPPLTPSQATENGEGQGALTQQGFRAGHTQAPGGHKPTRLQTAAPSEQALGRQAWQGGWKEGSCCPEEAKSV